MAWTGGFMKDLYKLKISSVWTHVHRLRCHQQFFTQSWILQNPRVCGWLESVISTWLSSDWQAQGWVPFDMRKVWVQQSTEFYTNIYIYCTFSWYWRLDRQTVSTHFGFELECFSKSFARRSCRDRWSLQIVLSIVLIRCTFTCRGEIIWVNIR